MKKTVMAAALAGVMLLSGCSGVSQENSSSTVDESSNLQTESSSSESTSSETGTSSSVESSSSLNSDTNDVSQALNNSIKPLTISPETVRDMDVLMAKIVMDIMFNSADEMYASDETEKKVAQGALNTTLCFLDNKDGTNFYSTEKDVIEKVLFVDDTVDVEKNVVTAIFDTLVNAKNTINDPRYSSLENEIKAMKSTYGENVISANNDVKLCGDIDLSLLVIDCYMLGNKNIEDIENANAALDPAVQEIIGSVTEMLIENIKEARDSAIITLSKLAYNIKVTDEELLQAEKNIAFLIESAGIENGSGSSSTQTEKPVESQTPPVQDTVTTGERNALKKAQSYLDFSAFSHDGLVEQLEYEGFTNSEAVYGADNVGADWNEQAVKKSKSYLDFSAFSYTGLIDQLEYEKFTHEQAVYGADNCGADWNEQAVKKAKSYLEFSSFSKDGLIGQLEFEGFTHDQAVYGAEQNGY